MKKIAIFLIGLAAAWLLPAKGQIVSENDTLPQGVYSDEQISEILRNMPNIEVGKGLTFKTKDDKYKLTLRLRMQSLAGITLNDQFSVTQTEACIKRLRLRFDGHVFSPKLTQVGQFFQIVVLHQQILAQSSCICAESAILPVSGQHLHQPTCINAGVHLTFPDPALMVTSELAEILMFVP